MNGYRQQVMSACCMQSVLSMPAFTSFSHVTWVLEMVTPRSPALKLGLRNVPSK